MKAASLNYRDYLMVQGVYNSKQPLPLIPVSDGVGEIVAVGNQVRRVAIGDRVNPTFGQGWISGLVSNEFRHITLGGPLDGTLSEYMVLDADGVVKVPDTLTDGEAATLPCAALTAWSALIEQGNLRPGQTLVIQGTGGVALFALQFAKLIGAHVIITSKSDEKLERCKAMGADHGINYKTTPEWGNAVRKLTSGGADHVLELGGAATLQQSIRAVRPSGTISLIGVLGGPVAEVLLPLVVMQNLRLQGVTVGSRNMHENMIRAVGQNQIKPVIDSIFPLDQTREAFEYMGAGQHFGKICIRISD
jgi:NADPH:quinone reductase-like Zn-dependent oxidoreductase